MDKILFIAVIFLTVILSSCNDSESDKLRESIHKEYTLSKTKTSKLSSGSKAQYIQIEETINEQYVKELDSLINSGYERQLEKFEEGELGFWSGYMHMFAWLFKSKQSWNDEMRILSDKYFNSIDLNQEQHCLYVEYRNRIQNLRQQFIVSQNLPSYTQIELPKESITLDSFSNHARNNVAIELGTELFEWFLGFVIVQIVLLFVDKIAGAWGCLIDIIVFIVIIVSSIIMVNNNDKKLIDNLREQYQESVDYDSAKLLNELNTNTVEFYEHL